MSKHRDPLIEALDNGESYQIKVPEGGDLASMRLALKHGQTLTLSPVSDYAEIQAGDIVFLKWRGGSYILHLVKEIQGDQFLIINSLGKINGWVHGSAILGRVTEIIEPEPMPGVPEMLDRLEAAYSKLVEHRVPPEEEVRRLHSVVGDLRWYAARLGPERWEGEPRQNKWSFVQILWYLTRQAEGVDGSENPDPVCYLIDQGKEQVGQVAGLMDLF